MVNGKQLTELKKFVNISDSSDTNIKSEEEGDRRASVTKIIMIKDKRGSSWSEGQDERKSSMSRSSMQESYSEFQQEKHLNASRSSIQGIHSDNVKNSEKRYSITKIIPVRDRSLDNISDIRLNLEESERKLNDNLTDILSERDNTENLRKFSVTKIIPIKGKELFKIDIDGNFVKTETIDKNDKKIQRSEIFLETGLEKETKKKEKIRERKTSIELRAPSLEKAQSLNLKTVKNEIFEDLRYAKAEILKHSENETKDKKQVSEITLDQIVKKIENVELKNEESNRLNQESKESSNAEVVNKQTSNSTSFQESQNFTISDKNDEFYNEKLNVTNQETLTQVQNNLNIQVDEKLDKPFFVEPNVSLNQDSKVNEAIGLNETHDLNVQKFESFGDARLDSQTKNFKSDFIKSDIIFDNSNGIFSNAQISNTLETDLQKSITLVEETSKNDVIGIQMIKPKEITTQNEIDRAISEKDEDLMKIENAKINDDFVENLNRQESNINKINSQYKAPMFTQLLEDQCFTDFDNIHLDCLVEGEKPIKVDWFFNDILITSLNDTNIEIYREIGVCSMEIISANKFYSGVYKCRASNSFGYDETICNLVHESLNSIQNDDEESTKSQDSNIISNELILDIESHGN